MPNLIRFYCKNCRLDTTIAEPLPRICPRCRCGVSLNELYPGQSKLGTTFINPLSLKVAPTFMPEVNFQQNKKNSGFKPNPTTPPQQM